MLIECLAIVDLIGEGRVARYTLRDIDALKVFWHVIGGVYLIMKPFLTNLKERRLFIALAIESHFFISGV